MVSKDDMELVLTPTKKEPQCPYRLLNILFSDMFSEGWHKLGMWLTSSNLTQAKHPTINYFGKVSKKPLRALLN